MLSFRRNSGRSAMACGLAASLGLGTLALAEFTWDGTGGDDLWTTGGNWVGGTAPLLDLANDDLVFGATGGAQSPDAGAGEYVNIGSIAFTGADATLTLIGTGSLSFIDGATITNDSALLQAIEIDLIGTGDDLIIDALTGDFDIAGDIDLSDTGGVALTVRGDNDTALTGVLSGNGGSLIKQGAGALTIAGDNTYAGGTTLESGTIILGSDTALGTGLLEVTGDAALQSDDNDRELNNGISIDELVTLTFSGADGLEINGVIEGDGSIAIDMDADDDELRINRINSFSGGVTLTRGVLAIGHGRAFGEGSLTVNGDASLRSVFGSVNSSNDILIEAARTLTVIGDRNLVLQGDITGDGALAIDFDEDDHVLTLSGENAFSGGTTLDTGTLRLGHDDALGTGTLTLAGDGTIESTSDSRTILNDIDSGGNVLTFGGTSDLELAGVISGTGGLLVDASASLVLSGVSTYTGDTNVDGGTLDLVGSVGGDLLVNDGGTLDLVGSVGGDLFVNDGGILVGEGTAGGNVTLADGAVFRPAGGDMGIFTIGGDYLQEEDSTLTVDIDFDGSSDLVDITGTATLENDSTINAQVSGSSFATSGTTFTIISAAGGVTDDGATITSNSVSVTLQLVRDEDFTNGDTEYILELLRADDAYSAAADTANNRIIGSTLDSMVPLAEADPTGDVGTLLAQLDTFSTEPYNTALDELSPEPYNVVTLASIDIAQAYHAGLSEYLRAKRYGIQTWPRFRQRSAPDPGSLVSADNNPALLAAAFAQMQDETDEDSEFTAAGPRVSRFGTHGMVYGVFRDQDEGTVRSGFDLDAVGGQLGLDYRITPDFTLGVSAGYTDSEIDIKRGGNVDGDVVRVGPYFSVTGDKWHLDGALSFGFHSYDSKREMRTLDRTAKGSFDGTDYTAFVAGAYDFNLTGNARLSPFASFQYSGFDFDGLTEKDADAANLDVDSREPDASILRLGVDLAWPVDVGVKLLPYLSVGWEHDFSDDDDIDAAFIAGGDPFRIDPGSRDSDAFFFGAGLSAVIERNFSAFLRVDTEYADDGDAQAITGGFTFTF